MSVNPRLFNRLTRSRDAIVADIPGLTRDRHYGHGRLGDKPYLVVDTGGFEPKATEGILHEMAKQTRLAVDEADIVLFIVDGRTGLAAQDKIIAEQLRKTGRKILLVVNKTEGMPATVTAEFHELGLGDPCAVSAVHGDNVNELVELALADLPFPADLSEEDQEGKHPKIAIVGRPNVGKSTLVNTLAGGGAGHCIRSARDNTKQYLCGFRSKWPHVTPSLTPQGCGAAVRSSRPSRNFQWLKPSRR